MARDADAVVLVIGGDWGVEHEGMDRKAIDLPGGQNNLVTAIRAALTPGVPLVAVMVHGGSMDISTVLLECDAVVDAFYPGQFGARAIAETLFGLVTPGGKLPYTYYRQNYTSAIKMDDFACARKPGRGYRYMDPSDPHILLPCFHGLSYTTFTVTSTSRQQLTLDNSNLANSVTLTFNVKNIGSFSGTETVLGFFRPHNRTNTGGADLLPLQRRLFGFTKIGPLTPGGASMGTIAVTVNRTAMVDEAGSLVSIPGAYDIIVSTGAVGAREIMVSLSITGAYRVLETLPPDI